jgi:hypothetical protein
VFICLRTLLLAMLFLALPRPLPARAAECYRIAAAAGTGGTGEMARIVNHVFEAAGLCAEMLRLPPKRVGPTAEQGQVDGWVQAVDDENISDKMFFLSNDLGHLEGSLYWPPDLPEPRGGKIVIGAVLGQSWAQNEAHRRGTRLYEVRDNKQLLSMAASGRIQGFLVPAVTYRHFLVNFPELKNFRSLAVVDLRIRLALRADLEPLAGRLNAAVEQTIAEGFAAEVWRQYLEEPPGSAEWLKETGQKNSSANENSR